VPASRTIFFPMQDRTPLDPANEAAAILAAIVEASDDAIIAENLDGVVLSWSQGAEHLYGYSAGEMIGRPISILIPEGRLDELRSVIDRIRSGTCVKHHETERIAKDGRRVDISLTVSPIKDAAGRVIGASTIARDITAARQVAAGFDASEARWRSIVDSAVDGIIVIDGQGRIEAFNPGAERLFKYSEQEVIGQNVRLLMPSPYRDEHDQYLAEYRTTGVPKIIGIGREVTGLRRDGTRFPVHLAVGKMSVGGEQKFTGILHDLSARVALEERLRDQTALARLGEMAAVIAHEVKNPLAGVRGAIEILGGRFPDNSREASVVKEVLTRIDALNELMQDLLRFARPVQPRPVPVDVAELLRTTAALLTKDPALGRLRVKVAGSAAPLLADADLLQIVFLNLLLNGAHAMQGQGTIDVSVTADAQACQVTIADRGPGIPAEVREKIFTPFFTTKSRGTGLGLPTARRLIEAHHGSISVDCPRGGGTTVTIQLPAQTA
jgi:two-component system, LuxR family, sensor kinase FixL